EPIARALVLREAEAIEVLVTQLLVGHMIRPVAGNDRRLRNAADGFSALGMFLQRRFTHLLHDLEDVAIAAVVIDDLIHIRGHSWTSARRDHWTGPPSPARQCRRLCRQSSSAP